MPELVKIPAASAEYVGRFERPVIGFIANDRAKSLEAIVTALLPFQFKLANMEIVATGTPADYKVIFRIPERGISFTYGALDYKFGKDGSSWRTAEEDAKVFVAAERALLEGSDAKVESCALTIALHLQPVSKTRDEILAPFMALPFKSFLAGRKANSFATQVKWDGGDLLVDYSLGFANGVFIRLVTDFKGHPTLNDVMTKVRADEAALFELLGVEEAPGD